MSPQSPVADLPAEAEHLTLGRLCEIERGEGESATSAEMAAVEEWEAEPHRPLARAPLAQVRADDS
jgi:hypothetical protein